MSKINTIETKPKQSQFSQICWKHIHIRRILFKWVGPMVLFLKEYHIENLNWKNCNIFWLYNFRVFDTIKFVTFRKSWGHILKIHAKAKSSLIFPASSIFQQRNLKKNLKLYGLLVWKSLAVSSLQSHYKETVFFVPLSPMGSWYSFDWPRKDQSLSQLGVTQCFWTWDP